MRQTYRPRDRQSVQSWEDQKTERQSRRPKERLTVRQRSSPETFIDENKNRNTEIDKYIQADGQTLSKKKIPIESSRTSVMDRDARHQTKKIP